MRQYKIRGAGERGTRRARNLARAWTSAIEHIPRPARRLNGLLSLARALADAHNAIVFDEHHVIAGVPGGAQSEKSRELFERARGALEDELITPELYVARLAPERAARLALRWRGAGPGSLEVARAVAGSCAWALGLHPAAGDPPVGLPDADATL